MLEPSNQTHKRRRRSRIKPLLKEERISIIHEAWEKGLFSQLKPRLETIIKKRYGIDEEPQTLETIGEELNISRERVRQLEIRAERKLQTILKRLQKNTTAITIA